MQSKKEKTIQKNSSKKNVKYFKGVAKEDSHIQNMLRFHNDMKKKYYDTYLQEGQKIFEIAGGRGGDLRKIILRKPSKITLLNINQTALNEAKRRYNTYMNNTSLNFDRTSTDVQFIQENMTKNKIEINNKLGKVEFDIIAIQFAIHYFMKTEEIFHRVLEVVKKYLKKGGYFIFTCFDGKKVVEKLQNKEKVILEQMDYKKGEMVKLFEIQKKYNGDELEHFGQQISVFVETLSSTNDGGKIEYLVDSNYIIQTLEKNGFELVEYIGFDELYKNWMNPKKNKRLSEVEKEYSFLNSGFVFRKK
jgi:SAM-dependent methyltransferase